RARARGRGTVTPGPAPGADRGSVLRSRSARWGAGIAALVVVASAATWITWRQFAAPRAGALPAELPDPTEARLRQEVVRAPADPRPWRDLGDHFLARRPFSALWAYQETLARKPDDSEAWLGLAQAAARAGWFDVSTEIARSLLKRTLPAQGI